MCFHSLFWYGMISRQSFSCYGSLKKAGENPTSRQAVIKGRKDKKSGNIIVIIGCHCILHINAHKEHKFRHTALHAPALP